MKQVWLVDIQFKDEVLDTATVELPVCSGSDSFIAKELRALRIKSIAQSQFMIRARYQPTLKKKLAVNGIDLRLVTTGEPVFIELAE
jgi:hypothetical protein